MVVKYNLYFSRKLYFYLSQKVAVHRCDHNWTGSTVLQCITQTRIVHTRMLLQASLFRASHLSISLTSQRAVHRNINLKYTIQLISLLMLHLQMAVSHLSSSFDQSYCYCSRMSPPHRCIMQWLNGKYSTFCIKL
jgi:hypothetical protein